MVCKYGFLFIAPPDLELNKTKRWQWRFFILHDDAELTYSLDENVTGSLNILFDILLNLILWFQPLTLPQGRINMCKCDEVIELISSSSNGGGAKSKDGTGLASYPYALRLRFQAPMKDIYIAAGNYEDIVK